MVRDRGRRSGALACTIVAVAAMATGCPDRAKPAGLEPPAVEAHDAALALAAQDDPLAPEPEELLDRPDLVQMGLFDGSRFADLSRPSGLWILRDTSDMRSFEPVQAGGLSGIALGEKSLVLRLAAQDLSGRCVHVLAASDAPAMLRIGPVGTRGIDRAVGPGPTNASWQCFDEGEGVDVDLRIRSTKPAIVAGVWLTMPGTAPLDGPPPAQGCSTGQGGVVLEPGASVITRELLGPGEKLVVRLDGHESRLAAARVVALGDTGAQEKVTPGAGQDARTVINDGPDPRAFEIVASLPPSAEGPVCVRVQHVPVAAKGAALTSTRREVVILVMTDTMRQDLYPSEGSSFGVPMPTLAGLAERSTLYMGATAHASYTKPSVGTILTGLYPEEHGGLARKAPIAKSVPLLSEMLEKAGVTTVAFLSNFFFSPAFGLRRGWTDDRFIDPWNASMDDAVVLDEVEKWCAGDLPEGPLFVYVHLMGAHAPYTPPDDFFEQFLGKTTLASRIVPRETAQLIKDLTSGRTRKLDRRETDHIRALYRADAAYHDRIMKRLLAAFEKAGLMGRALLIYTSDHGEEFYEHGHIGHGTGLWYEQVRVPLMVHEPGQVEGRSVGTTAGHVDVLPTVLGALGVAVPEGMPGEDLLGLAAGPDSVRRGLLMQHWAGRWGLVMGPFKILRRPADEILLVLGHGAEEELSTSAHPVLHALMRTHLATQTLAMGAFASPSADPEPLDAEVTEQLEKLGYILK